MTNTDLVEPADEYVADLWIAIAKRQIREANEAQLLAVRVDDDESEKEFRKQKGGRG